MVYNGANSRSKRGGRFVYADGFVVVGLRMPNIYVATFVLDDSIADYILSRISLLSRESGCVKQVTSLSACGWKITASSVIDGESLCELWLTSPIVAVGYTFRITSDRTEL